MKETTNYKLKKIELTDSPPDITVHSGNFDVIDTVMKSIETKAEDAGTGLEDLEQEVSSHKADYVTFKDETNNFKTDYEYKTATVIGRQIRVMKQSSTNIVKFKLNADIIVGTQVTISLDGGITSKPLRDFEGIAVIDLEKGFVEVVADASFFTLRPKGGKKIDDVNYIITSQNGQYAIPKGQHSGNGKVKAQFANLIASNVNKGVSIGGVVGTLVAGLDTRAHKTVKIPWSVDKNSWGAIEETLTLPPKTVCIILPRFIEGYVDSNNTYSLRVGTNLGSIIGISTSDRKRLTVLSGLQLRTKGATLEHGTCLRQNYPSPITANDIITSYWFSGGASSYISYLQVDLGESPGSYNKILSISGEVTCIVEI